MNYKINCQINYLTESDSPYYKEDSAYFERRWDEKIFTQECRITVQLPLMDYRNVSENSKELPMPSSDSLPPSVSGTNSCSSSLTAQRTGVILGRPAAANAARERSRVQTLRHAFLELQRTLPSVPPDTKLSKLDVLLLATTYIAHLTRSLQDEEELPGESLGTLRGDGYLHPVKKWPMRSRLYIGATGQFLNHPMQTDNANQGETSANSQI